MRKHYDQAAKSSAPAEPSLREILARAGILSESEKQRLRYLAKRNGPASKAP